MQSAATQAQDQAEVLPDHTQLPDRDGSIVNNYQENPQSSLLSDCLRPRLHEVYPDGQFSIGCDSGIYYHHTQPPLAGCKAPDWLLVPSSKRAFRNTDARPNRGVTATQTADCSSSTICLARSRSSRDSEAPSAGCNTRISSEGPWPEVEAPSPQRSVLSARRL